MNGSIWLKDEGLNSILPNYEKREFLSSCIYEETIKTIKLKAML